MKWLFDTVNHVWHLWALDNPTASDQSLCGNHVADADFAPDGDTSAMPAKCSTCVANGRSQGLPI